MSETNGTYPGVTYVIPCGGEKLDHAAPARDLYTGQMFRHTLAAAERSARLDVEAGAAPAARVLILSARHGLIELDQVIEPYEQRMDRKGAIDPDTIAAQAVALGIDWDGGTVYALLPRPYLRALDNALRTLDVYVQDVYEASVRGIGDQRHTNGNVARPIMNVGPTDTVEPAGS